MLAGDTLCNDQLGLGAAHGAPDTGQDGGAVGIIPVVQDKAQHIDVAVPARWDGVYRPRGLSPCQDQPACLRQQASSLVPAWGLYAGGLAQAWQRKAGSHHTLHGG